MAGKENNDLFSQFSSNEGSLPLDFDKNTGANKPSGKEMEGKTETSGASPIISHPREEKNESQRRPTHHVPPPYKKTVQETAPVEPKNNVETKSNVVVQDKPIEKPEVEPVKNKDEVNPAAVTVEAVQTPVSPSIPSPSKIEVSVSTQASGTAAPISSIVPGSVPVVQEPVLPAVENTEKSPDAEPAPKRVRHSKPPQAVSTTAAVTEKQSEPPIQMKPDAKPKPADIKQQETKPSDITKQAAPVNVKKDAPPTVSHDRKVFSEQKVSKEEPQKPAKKASAVEKFSTDNATAGQLLQEGRVRSGLSIDQVSTKIKIKKAFIESMERDDFESLPAAVYVNAYTRALCSLYNIDDKLVFSLLRNLKVKKLDHTVPEEVIHQLEKGKQVNIVQENKVKKMIFTGFAACFTLVALISITYYFMYSGGRNSSSKKVEKPALNTELPVQTGLIPGISAKTLEEGMEKNLIAPHVFTMTSLPLAER